MNIPPKCEDLHLKIAELERREAALREELDSLPDVVIKNCNFEGKNGDGSQPFEFEILEGGLKKLTKVNLDGWLCYGPSGESPVASLQQRLTVAEKLLKRSQEFVAFVHKCCRKNKEYAPLHWQEMVELDRDLSALKPAEECPHNYSTPTGCPVCQGVKP